MKPSDRIFEIAKQRCARQSLPLTEVTLPDVANYLDEEHASQSRSVLEDDRLGALSFALEYLFPLDRVRSEYVPGEVVFGHVFRDMGRWSITFDLPEFWSLSTRAIVARVRDSAVAAGYLSSE